MWNHIKDTQPLASERIEIYYNGKIMTFTVHVSTVYNIQNNLLLRYDELEEWRYPKKETVKS